MKRIGLFLLCVAVLTAANPAFGQQAPHFLSPNIGNAAVPQTQFQQKNGGSFSSPATTTARTYVMPASGEMVPAPGASALQTKPVFQPLSEVPENGAARFLPPPAATPAPAIRPIAQNAITQNHQLRLPPQVFERNLIEKLDNRFVPARNAGNTPGLSQYNLPGRDGTNIELVVNRQNGFVSITGSPRMVESTLQIVRFLDTVDVPGGAVTRFVPVQQSNIESARRMADMMNRETMKIAQVNRPAVVVPPGAALGDDAAAGDPTLGRVLGSVNIDVVPDFNTIIMQGTPNDVAVIQAMIRQMETLSLENEPIIELVPMLHTDSLRVSQLVQTLYAQVYFNRRGAITLYPLVKPNTILIIGRKESIEAAKELMMKLDTPVDPNAQFQIFRLKHAAAETLGQQITQSIAGRPGNTIGLAAQVQTTQIVSDLRTNSLIVHANQRDMQEIAAMIKQLDVPGSEITSFVKTIRLKNALAQEMSTTIQNAFGTSTTTGRGAMLSIQGMGTDGTQASIMYNVYVAPDIRSNSLIVTAPPETMPLIEALIYQLDQLPAAESKMKVFHLVNGDAYTLTQVLTSMFAAGTTNQVATARPGIEEGESTLVGARFQADIRTNSIIAIGSEGDLIAIEALLLRLDAENLNNRKVFTMQLINSPVDELAPALRNYITSERQLIFQNNASFTPLSPQEQYRMETTIIEEPITNSLIISTTPQYYEQLRKIVQELDERPKMIAIDVLIAEVTLNNSRDRGVEFALQDSILFNSTAGTTGSGLLSPGTIPFVSTSTGTVGTQGITSLIPNTATGGFSLSASSESVSMFIRALETRNKTQILSRPQLKTLHNRRATIQVGGRVPYAGDVTDNATSSRISTQWQDIGTILDITPRVMPDDMVAIAVYIERNDLGQYLNIGPNTMAPQIHTTNASTTVNAMDGQTVIFAGLISEKKDSRNSSIPGLNKIPVLKHFVEYDSRECERKELLVIMTPRIIRTSEQMENLNQQERERMSWCISDVVRMTGDGSIRRRSDEWYPSEVRHTYGTPLKLQETQLPQENPRLAPIPMLPNVETQ